MYPVIQHTASEIKKLMEMYACKNTLVVSPLSRLRLMDDIGELINTTMLLTILEEGIMAGVYPGTPVQASQDTINHHLSTLEHDYYRHYKAMYIDHLEDVPLLINDEELEIIARWRLEIGK
jgi:hypothetical protein